MALLKFVDHMLSIHLAADSHLGVVAVLVDYGESGGGCMAKPCVGYNLSPFGTQFIRQRNIVF